MNELYGVPAAAINQAQAKMRAGLSLWRRLFRPELTKQERQEAFARAAVAAGAVDKVLAWRSEGPAIKAIQNLLREWGHE